MKLMNKIGRALLSCAASEAYSLNDRQGGARGFIVKRV